ncbi:hypothetical protein V6N12_074629 [Hibiscus sabdariffa]|uniref:Uncharacterized protein n=1 Tax=Hibiscus sabdariffa TaxID=183260 RepID=A0ABR2BXZ9_9ROSI
MNVLLTPKPAAPSKPAKAHTGKACTWISIEYRPEGSDALTIPTEDEVAEQSRGGSRLKSTDVCEIVNVWQNPYCKVNGNDDQKSEQSHCLLNIKKVSKQKAFNTFSMVILFTLFVYMVQFVISSESIAPRSPKRAPDAPTEMSFRINREESTLPPNPDKR